MHSVSKPHASFGTHLQNLNEGRPIYYQRRRCSLLTLVLTIYTRGKIVQFVRIFAGVTCRGGFKRQWGNRKRRFSGLLDATSSAS